MGELDAVSAGFLMHAIPRDEFVGFVAEASDGGVVGSVGLSPYQMPPKPIQHDGRFGYVSSMYVLPNHRRHGLGRRLLAAVVDHATSMGLTWLTLHASSMGRPIYESVGFESWNEMGLHVPSVRNLYPADRADASGR